MNRAHYIYNYIYNILFLPKAGQERLSFLYQSAGSAAVSTLLTCFLMAVCGADITIFYDSLTQSMLSDEIQPAGLNAAVILNSLHPSVILFASIFTYIFYLIRQIHRYSKQKQKMQKTAGKLVSVQMQLADFSSYGIQQTGSLLGRLSRNSKEVFTDSQNTDTLSYRQKILYNAGLMTAKSNDVFKVLRSSCQHRENRDRNPDSFLLDPVLDKVLNQYKSYGNASIHAKTEPGLIIKFPRIYMHAVLHILLQNSFRFQDKSRPLEISIHAYRVKKYFFFSEFYSVIIEYKDNGTGFDAEKYRDKVFRLNKTFHREISGKGTGLFRLNYLLDAYGYEAEINSRPGHGMQLIIKMAQV